MPTVFSLYFASCYSELVPFFFLLVLNGATKVFWMFWKNSKKKPPSIPKRKEHHFFHSSFNLIFLLFYQLLFIRIVTHSALCVRYIIHILQYYLCRKCEVHYNSFVCVCRSSVGRNFICKLNTIKNVFFSVWLCLPIFFYRHFCRYSRKDATTKKNWKKGDKIIRVICGCARHSKQQQQQQQHCEAQRKQTKENIREYQSVYT